MSAKGKRGTPNKKLSTKSLSKTLTEPAFPLADQDSLLTVYEQIRKKRVANDLVSEYEYLSIQTAESFYLIEAMKCQSAEATRTILAEKLYPYYFQYSPRFGDQTGEDESSLKEIYASIATDAAEYGYRFGFRPYQLSIWLTMAVKILTETLVQLKSNANFQISDYTTIINRIFLQFLPLQEPSYGHIPLFTTSECKEMIEYLKRGFIMHSNLFKFVILCPQEHIIYKERRKFDVAPQVESMRDAINELDWPNYCQQLEEKAEKERQDAIYLENARILAEIERAEKERSEKHTQSLKAKLAECEKAMLTPLPPYPIPPPPLPTMEQIFRKQIITKAEVPVVTPAVEETKPTPTVTASTPPTSAKSRKPLTKKTQSAAKKTATPQPTTPSPDPIKPRKARDLPPPPDMSTSKPLERTKLSTPEPVSAPILPVFAPIITTIEYVDIPLTHPLSRTECAEIVATSVTGAVEEYKSWVIQQTQWEEQQWTDRLSDLHKARADRDADLKLRQSKITPKAPASAAPKEKKGKK